MVRISAILPLLLIQTTVLAAHQNAPPRICLAPTSVEANTGNAPSAATAVREAFTSFLGGSTFEIHPLNARLQSLARAEAKEASCAYLLVTTVKHVRKTGGGGFLGKVAGAAVRHGASSVSVATGVAGNVAGRVLNDAAYAAASEFAGTVRNQDALTLGYRLETAGGRALVNKNEKRKATSDGEDLLTPVVEKAAEEVANAVMNAAQ